MPPPAYLALGGQSLAVVFGNHGRFAECAAIFFEFAVRVPLRPGAWINGRIDAHHAMGARTPSFAQLLGDPATLAHLRQEARASCSEPIAEPPPVGGQTGATDRANHQFARADLVGQFFQIVVRGVDIDVRRKEEQIDAVELHAVNFRSRRQIEHRIELDRRFGIWSLADHTRPGRVVKLREIVRMRGAHAHMLLNCDETCCFAIC